MRVCNLFTPDRFMTQVVLRSQVRLDPLKLSEKERVQPRTQFAVSICIYIHTYRRGSHGGWSGVDCRNAGFCEGSDLANAK